MANTAARSASKLLSGAVKARRFLGNGDTFGGVTNLWSSAYDHLRQFTAANRWTNGVIANR